MPDISLDFRPQRQMDFRHIEEALHNVIGNDSLRIKVERSDAEQTDRLLDLLDSHGFNFDTKSHGEDEYWIIATRKN